MSADQNPLPSSPEDQPSCAEIEDEQEEAGPLQLVCPNCNTESGIRTELSLQNAGRLLINIVILAVMIALSILLDTNCWGNAFLPQKRKCTECGHRFWLKPVRITQPICESCKYNLTGNVSGICPECGWKLTRAVKRRVRRKAKSNR